MLHFLRSSLLVYLLSASCFGAPSTVELAVWANEAITSTFNYDYQHFIDQQRAIAKYFNSAGWASYSQTFNQSGIPATVQANKYYVSAVSTWPPNIKSIGQNSWQAIMPVLVIYKNPQYQQKQTLEVTINFSLTPIGGVRGLAIDALQQKKIEAPCECKATDFTGKS